MRELFVTLGHNSSAVLAEGGKVVRGYEQERLDLIKSSSAYPSHAIECALRNERVDVAYVSHWFDDFRLRDSKYLSLSHLHRVADKVVTLSSEFTHHDAHARSVIEFYASNGGDLWDGADVLVIDGFGNRGECLSAYACDDGNARMKHRSFGYGMSLGLMYQYVTEYLGMKANQDEYKLLGYEAHAVECMTSAQRFAALNAVDADATEHVNRMLDAKRSDVRVDSGDWPIDIGLLRDARAKWWRLASEWRSLFPGELSQFATRAVVAMCAQRFIEQCTIALIGHLFPGGRPTRPLLLAGGCFLNVKLSRKIQVTTGRQIFSHPLAGDQGAAMGLVQGLDQQGLLWGQRSAPATDWLSLPAGCRVVDGAEWVEEAARALSWNQIVNVVRGNMEYGPRALCNTSTLAHPTKESVRIINQLNDRDEAMPMAPVVQDWVAPKLFNSEELAAIGPGQHFMINTVAFARPPSELLQGVAHRDPHDRNLWTARPQVVHEGDDMYSLLDELDATCLINTSFNYHGEPIVFGELQAVTTHLRQCQRANALNLAHPVTLLVR